MSISEKSKESKADQEVMSSIPKGDGRFILMTGATSGIGKEMCQMLLQRGYRVIVCMRNHDKYRQMLQGSDKNVVSRCTAIECDLSSFSSCMQAVREIKQMGVQFDCIFANAGAICGLNETTNCNLNKTFFTNHTGHFILINGILERLGTDVCNRVVVQSSVAHWTHSRKLDFSQYFHEQKVGSEQASAYSDSKLANLLFTQSLSRILKKRGSSALAVAAHPGYAVTNINHEMVNKPLLKTLMQVWGGNRCLLLKLGRGLKLCQPNLRIAALPAMSAAFSQSPPWFTGPDGWFGLRGIPVGSQCHSHVFDRALQDELWALTEAYLVSQGGVSRESIYSS